MSKGKKKVQEEEYDDRFAYIAGYTSGGFPYGITWDEMGIADELPLDEKIGILKARYDEEGCIRQVGSEDMDDSPVSMENPDANVFLEDIAAMFYEAMEGWSQFLNRETGEFISVPDPSFGFTEVNEEDRRRMDEIMYSDDFICLPEQYELNEYGIMEEFASGYPDKEISERLGRILRQRKPFRRFKDAINGFGIADEYYDFRDAAYIRKAERWCLDYHVFYKRK